MYGLLNPPLSPKPALLNFPLTSFPPHSDNNPPTLERQNERKGHCGNPDCGLSPSSPLPSGGLTRLNLPLNATAKKRNPIMLRHYQTQHERGTSRAPCTLAWSAPVKRAALRRRCGRAAKCLWRDAQAEVCVCFP